MNQVISDLFDKDLAVAAVVPKIKKNLRNKVEKTMETVYVKKGHKGLWITLIVLCAVAVGVYFLLRYLHKDDEFKDDLDDDDLDFLDDDDDEKEDEDEDEADESEEETQPTSYAEAPVESAAEKTAEAAEEETEEAAAAEE
jgi:cytoskeletal protein RodZ